MSKSVNLKNKSVMVLGAGKSGISAVRFLLKKGSKVSLYDGNPAEKPIYEELRALGCELFLGEDLPDMETKKYDLAVISPGIPLKDPCARLMRFYQVPIWGELELASRFIKKPIVGITGTNGKTTTTTLIGEILKKGGFKTFVGGNIGVPLLDSLDDDYDFYVVEMSSFQLETIETLDAFVSVYLNLTPDHLDRHGTMENYLDAKAQMMRLQSKGHYVVLNYDDPYLRDLANMSHAKTVFFSREDHIYMGTSVLPDETIMYSDPSVDQRFTPLAFRDEIRLPGPHNLENAMAAATAAFLCGVKPVVIRETLREFAGVEHRLEDVMTYKGVRYVNDSKATNPDSVFKALDSYGETPIVLIAGGRNKGNSFDDLAKVINEKCRSLILIGEAAEDIRVSAEKAGMVGIYMAEDMNAAVKKAAEIAQKGDVVLLSPANASFDQFKSFEHRGQVFKECVLNLRK